MVIVCLILEENKRLNALIPIYEKKISEHSNPVQKSRYNKMMKLVLKDLEELKPFVELACKMNNLDNYH